MADCSLMSHALQSQSIPVLEAEIEIALQLAADIGEGPIWDAETATLLFVDSTAGRVFRLAPSSGELSSFDVGQEIGVAIPRRGGGLVISGRDGLLAADAAGPPGLLVPIEYDRKTHRMNDAKCDSRGRLWGGTFSTVFEKHAGGLYRVDPDLTVTRAQGEISVSNGIAWSPDETRMYYVDTSARGVDVFDYDIETGGATNRRRFADVGRGSGVPDGITIDAEGCLWVALYLGGSVRRYTPDGDCAGQIVFPVKRVTSCGFGGPELADLYVTTARHKMTEAELKNEPQAGSLFRCRTGVLGLPANRFGG